MDVYIDWLSQDFFQPSSEEFFSFLSKTSYVPRNVQLALCTALACIAYIRLKYCIQKQCYQENKGIFFLEFEWKIDE